MKTILVFLCGFVFQTNTYVQNKQQAEKAFVAELNSIIKNTKKENEGFKFDGKTIIEQEFALNEKGILSIFRTRNKSNLFFSLDYFRVKKEKNQQTQIE